MKKIILVLLCLTMISMGEVNAQDDDYGQLFYGYMRFPLDTDEGPGKGEESRPVYFITDIVRECDYGNRYSSNRPDESDLVRYVSNKYPTYYKYRARSAWAEKITRPWAEKYPASTLREAYNMLWRDRSDHIDEIRTEDDNPIIVMIPKIDFNFFQDCN